MPPPSVERILDVAGVANLRDYGGYPVSGGGRMRRGLLFRSGDLSAAEAQGRERLGALGLSAIVDLRSEAERSQSPSRLPLDFQGAVVSAKSYLAARAPHVAALSETPSADSVRASLRRAYARIPFQAPMIDVFGLYFRTLVETPGPTLVHCAAGKDRTGIAVALLQSALGVHSDDIMADFLLTNLAAAADGRLEAGAERLRRVYGASIPPDAVQAALGVDPTYLQAMFDAVGDRGGVSVYLAETLGVSHGEADRLRDRVLTA